MSKFRSYYFNVHYVPLYFRDNLKLTAVSSSAFSVHKENKGLTALNVSFSTETCNGPHYTIPGQPTPSINVIPIFKVPPKKLSFRFCISLSDMMNYKSADF